MLSVATILALFTDLTCPPSHVPGVHGHALPFVANPDEPHFLVENGGWIVYIGQPVERREPVFVLARSNDDGEHWWLSRFEDDWYPEKVRLARGRLDIHFHVVYCEPDSRGCEDVWRERLEGRIDDPLWEKRY
jgi:hypothetical protein